MALSNEAIVAVVGVVIGVPSALAGSWQLWSYICIRRSKKKGKSPFTAMDYFSRIHLPMAILLLDRIRLNS